MRGNPIDIDDYVKNVSTGRVGKIYKIVREKSYGDAKTTIRCVSIKPSTDAHYSQGIGNIVKCDVDGVPVV